jgi:hypothetical protein
MEHMKCVCLGLACCSLRIDLNNMPSPNDDDLTGDLDQGAISTRFDFFRAQVEKFTPFL